MASAPYEVRMDARQAREFTERGGAVLLLDVPAGTSMSVDHQVHGASAEPNRLLKPNP